MYRIATLARKCIRLIPSHLANDAKALLAFGYLAKGVTISWNSFIDAPGY